MINQNVWVDKYFSYYLGLNDGGDDITVICEIIDIVNNNNSKYPFEGIAKIQGYTVKVSSLSLDSEWHMDHFIV